MPQVEPLGESALQPLHSLTQVPARGFKEEVDVIGHQAVSKADPAELVAGVVQDREVRPSVTVVGEEVPAIDPSRPNVVEPAVKNGSRLPGHVDKNPGSGTHAPCGVVC